MTSRNRRTVEIRTHRLLGGALFSLYLIGSAIAAPTRVDTELLLMVDVSGSVDAEEYGVMIDAYGSAMTNGSVIDAIQSGSAGKIATAVLFWSSDTRQVVGVDWMEISDLSSARDFASKITSLIRPFMGTTAIGAALNVAIPLFGTETGHAENGFSSVTQIIDVAGDGIDNSSPPRVADRALNVEHSRDAALAAGVEMINGLALNTETDDLHEYYANHVIGGGAGGTAAFVEHAEDFADYEATLLRKLVGEIKAGAAASTISAVPEASHSLLALLGGMFFLARRRR